MSTMIPTMYQSSFIGTSSSMYTTRITFISVASSLATGRLGILLPLAFVPRVCSCQQPDIARSDGRQTCLGTRFLSQESHGTVTISENKLGQDWSTSPRSIPLALQAGVFILLYKPEGKKSNYERRLTISRAPLRTPHNTLLYQSPPSSASSGNSTNSARGFSSNVSTKADTGPEDDRRIFEPSIGYSSLVVVQKDGILRV